MHVIGELGADDLGPAGGQAGRRGLGCPPPIADQPVDGAAEQLGIAARTPGVLAGAFLRGALTFLPEEVARLRARAAASESSLSAMVHPSLHDLDPGTGEHSGDILGDRRRDEGLLSRPHVRGQVRAPLRVELGEDVIQDQDR